jgi:moderate conductance mechanosensitive channel
VTAVPGPAERATDQARDFGDFLTEHHEVLVVKPLRILLILVVALLVRFLVHRAISRAVRSTADTDVPVVLRPLKERLGADLLEQAGLVSERRRQRAETVGSLLRSVASLVIGVLALMLVFGEVGFQLGPFIAGAGIVGIALGFGAQNLVKDFLSGIFMILEDQYGVGDVVDLGEASGTVEGVGLRVTRLRDASGTVWYVRNGEVLRVGNRSQGFAQVIIDLPVPYEADFDEVGDTMKAAADGLADDEDWSGSLLEEPQLLGVEQIGEDRVVLRLTVKVRPADQWRVARELRRRIAERLDADVGPRDRTADRLDVRTEPARAESPDLGELPGAEPARADGVPGEPHPGPAAPGQAPRADGAGPSGPSRDPDTR